MKYIKGEDRTQSTLFPVSLDDAVDPENEVRLIDVFVESLLHVNLKKSANGTLKSFGYLDA